MQEKCSLYWLPSINLTIDEVMLKFEGRITQKIIISDKSISTEFKIFALGDSGYIYNWKCTRPELTEEVLAEKTWISVNISRSDNLSFFLNPTQSVIVQLNQYLSIYVQKELFVYWKSAIALKECRITIIVTI